MRPRYWLVAAAVPVLVWLGALAHLRAQPLPTFAAPAPPNQPVATPTCAPVWEQVPSPNVGTDRNVLNGIIALSSANRWAVGYSSTFGQPNQTLIEHWDRAAWKVITPTVSGVLRGVAATSADDIWAVGEAAGTLIMHWDGTTWSVVPSPSPGTYSNGLYGVAAVAPNDVWAVGAYSDEASMTRDLILHWDGRSWTAVPPVLSAANRVQLYGVAARAADDIWAVGADHPSNSYNTVILHWNGAQWSGVWYPAGSESYLYGVAAPAADDAWTVGQQQFGDLTLAEHWDGTQWNIVASPNYNAPINWLYGIAAGTPGATWAVGGSYTAGRTRTLTTHWDGASWVLIDSPSPGSVYNGLYSVAALSATDVWAVGTFHSGGQWQTLVLRLVDPPCSTPHPTATQTGTPTAGPTGTPANLTPTVSPVPGTATATPGASSTPAATVTACAISYSDVPAGSVFARYIGCLACRGVVGGYSDGTFHPDSGVTRGQLAKFVSNAAGYDDPIPATRQTFADVPAGQPFWLFIERAYAHGVIAGYSDGTFHPNNPVTRGQVAKFVANAAQYADAIAATQQSFTDVPGSHPFWLFIERVARHGVAGGYSNGDGTFSFRPGNPVTRGQTSKFIANAFFPACNGDG
jgi:hypothetical protein